ncbi:class 1 fructose-bisphosphatase [Idiomarina tyrosinivorans]|uniref:Fructose-1,6-bisphosphatase class 1 n=1 Tax=Idiomarina tyrosinivorans TaxID=1445662 RepID=A0A432ZRZ1_9GAMM|nr:class 1 fructose-bisphosphatase [Idiomarina tyrosinivorans]RUO80659.1 class 1 fructose-bisphosphatase [Idiomarina tyrosinivorans]
MKRLIPTLRADACEESLISVLNTVQTAAKEIAFRLHQGAMAGVLGSTLDENIQGETQKKLDVVANQLLKDLLLECQYVHAVASEEEDSIVVGDQRGEYLIAFDPLDGSSNIDINGLVGTIFSVLPRPAGIEGEEMFLQPGKNQVAAGYVLYGPSTMLVLTTGQSVRMYTLDQTVGEFLLTKPEVKIPHQTQEFAINMSNKRHWSTAMHEYISDLLAGKEGPREKNFNMRWIAAMVGDVHRVLSRGGLFTYPWDKRKPNKPFKLRLLYEANPMAMLVEKADGLATDGYDPIMTIQPTDIHQRVGVVLGSKEEVESCMAYHANHPKPF